MCNFLSLLILSLSLLTSPLKSSPEPSDINRLIRLQGQIGSNLTTLNNIRAERAGKLSFAYTQKLEIMNLRFADLKSNIEKLSGSVPDKEYRETRTRQLLSEAVPLAEETSYDLAYFNAAPLTADGEVDVNITYTHKEKSATGWRVAAVGQYDRPSNVRINDFIDQLCNDQNLREAAVTYRESSTKTPPIKMRVVVGTVYFWTRHPEHCADRSEPHVERGLGKVGSKDPHPIELTAPGLTPQ